jgi:hypothetical protein
MIHRESVVQFSSGEGVMMSEVCCCVVALSASQNMEKKSWEIGALFSAGALFSPA